MRSSTVVSADRFPRIRAEIAKLPAFFRRDLLVMWSYRMAFVTDWINLMVQIVIFSFVDRMVDVTTLPRFGGTRVTYLQFVAVGIALASFMQIGMIKIVTVIRQEQLMGTLETLLLTPTRPFTILLGSVAYDIVYVPLRTLLFFIFSAWVFDIQFDLSGLGPAAAVFAALIPFIWGLGVLSAGAILTFRRGAGATGIGGTLLTVASGAYFPISVLPGWLQVVADYNPVTAALTATRQAMLSGAAWSDVLPTIAALLPWGIASLLAGFTVFRMALARERRRGTLAIY